MYVTKDLRNVFNFKTGSALLFDSIAENLYCTDIHLKVV